MQQKHGLTPQPATFEVPWHVNPRALNAGCAVTCALLLLYGYYLEMFVHLPPCPLCVLQRVVIVMLGVAFFAAAVHDPRGRAATAYGGSIGVLAAIGAGIAGRHVWLLRVPSDQPETCLPGLGYLLNALPIADTFRLVLLDSASCGGTEWSFLGLNIPEWTLIAFIVLGVAGAVGNWSARKRPG